MVNNLLNTCVYRCNGKAITFTILPHYQSVYLSDGNFSKVFENKIFEKIYVVNMLVKGKSNFLKYPDYNFISK